ncbi:hypothetical protein EPO34_02640 [Patescibacteria group bacterium]|nr:MAG: hypothetical protein EPO34_02640 [Patescibacteria group bacterium]
MKPTTSPATATGEEVDLVIAVTAERVIFSRSSAAGGKVFLVVAPRDQPSIERLAQAVTGMLEARWPNRVVLIAVDAAAGALVEDALTPVCSFHMAPLVVLHDLTAAFEEVLYDEEGGLSV